MDKYLKYFFLILLIYSLIIAFLAITCDTFYTIKYGGIDLRNRVVGTRNLLVENDPYYTKWDVETPEYFVDGRDYQWLPVSRCTVPPSFLVLHVPFAKISYKTQQYLWFAAQELLLIFSILLLAKAAGKKYKIVLIIGFMFFLGSSFWRFHVANGQIYILFVFIITAAYLVAKSTFKYRDFWSGFILGLAASWRPPMILMGLPFIFYKKWKLIFGGIAGIIVGFLSSLLLTGISTWQSYFSAMKIHGLFHSGLLQPELKIHPNSNFIEGVRNSFFSADVPSTDSSIQGVLYKFFGFVLDAKFLWLGFFVIVLLLGFSLWRKRKLSVPIEMLFFQGTVLVLISEFLLPAARLSYNNVIWLVPLSMLIIMVRDVKRLLNFPLIFLLIGFAANYLYNLFPRSILIADYSILIYLIWMWFAMLRDNPLDPHI
ncbi:MAG: glycosyltransferase family 87 protein [Candidatus Cloacimonadales bacterium]|nr:glycosyltransferase family 87 protein [Candidatus Cloacimonadales bacterium]